MIWRKACFKSSPLATDSSRRLRSGDVPFSFGSELRCRPSELEPEILVISVHYFLVIARETGRSSCFRGSTLWSILSEVPLPCTQLCNLAEPTK